jgi:hypothetical protein
MPPHSIVFSQYPVCRWIAFVVLSISCILADKDSKRIPGLFRTKHVFAISMHQPFVILAPLIPRGVRKIQEK